MKATYIGHDIESARTAAEILKRLKMPTALTDKVFETIRLHMRCHGLEEMKRQCKVRRLLGSEVIDTLVELVDADEKATVNETGNKPIYFKEAVSKYRDRYPTMLPEPIVSGNDLIKAGKKPSQAFGYALQETYDRQLDGLTDKEKLVKVAVSMVNQFDGASDELKEKFLKKVRK
jgi:hypothetical protein